MKRIALIEDDSDIAFTIRLNLEREGYTVIHFGRGQDGLMAVQRGGFDGSGLGLAITKHLILQHQGSIDVESEAGMGATFDETSI